MNHTKPIDTAVALHWNGDGAPRITAKGRGELARRILDAAREHDVPVDEDPELVELLARVDVGTQIPELLFTAVAEVIAFAYTLHDQLPGHVVDRLRAGDPPERS